MITVNKHKRVLGDWVVGKRGKMERRRDRAARPPQMMDLTTDSPASASQSTTMDLTADSPDEPKNTMDLTGDSSPSSSQQVVDLTADERFAHELANVCALCDMRQANPGFDRCEACFLSTLRVLCTLCNASPPNPGFSWCQGCYLSSVGVGGRHAGGAGRGHHAGGRRYAGGFHAGGGHADHAGGGFDPGGAPREGATYEELLEWEASRGTAVRLGLGRHDLARLPARPFLGTADALKGDEATCVICQEEYKAGEQLSVLPACAHTFHEACVGRWLQDKASCPMCQRDVKGDLRSAE